VSDMPGYNVSVPFPTWTLSVGQHKGHLICKTCSNYSQRFSFGGPSQTWNKYVKQSWLNKQVNVCDTDKDKQADDFLRRIHLMVKEDECSNQDR